VGGFPLARPRRGDGWLIDNRTDYIVCAHFVGHAGEELIHIFALAIKHGITATEIRDFVYGFPTFSADIKSML